MSSCSQIAPLQGAARPLWYSPPSVPVSPPCNLCSRKTCAPPAGRLTKPEVHGLKSCRGVAYTMTTNGALKRRMPWLDMHPPARASRAPCFTSQIAMIEVLSCPNQASPSPLFQQPWQKSHDRKTRSAQSFGSSRAKGTRSRCRCRCLRHKWCSNRCPTRPKCLARAHPYTA